MDLEWIRAAMNARGIGPALLTKMLAALRAELMDSLPPEQKRAISLSFEHGLTHTQIAQVTQLPLGTVKSHVRRGLERVRGLIEKQRDTEPESGAQEVPEST
jgi:RNA polymerase sigma-70 factor (ECF subfamily)